MRTTIVVTYTLDEDRRGDAIKAVRELLDNGELIVPITDHELRLGGVGVVDVEAHEVPPTRAREPVGPRPRPGMHKPRPR